MPTAPSTWYSGPLSPQQLNGNLYSFNGAGYSANGILFHAHRTVLHESMSQSALFTVSTTGTWNRFPNTATTAFSILDTGALFGVGCDNPGGNALYQFLPNAVGGSGIGYTPGSTTNLSPATVPSVPAGAGGNYLVSHFATGQTATTGPAAIGAGMYVTPGLQHYNFISTGAIQAHTTTVQGCAPFIDLINAGGAVSGTVASPVAYQQITSVYLPQGFWQNAWTIQISGTASSADANNFALVLGISTIATSSNAGATGTYVETGRNIIVTEPAGQYLSVTAGPVTPTTGATYAAQLFGYYMPSVGNGYLFQPAGFYADGSAVSEQLPANATDTAGFTPRHTWVWAAVSLQGTMVTQNPNPYTPGGNLAGWSVSGGTITAATPPGNPPPIPSGVLLTAGSGGAVTAFAPQMTVDAGTQYQVTSSFFPPQAVTAATGFAWLNTAGTLISGSSAVTTLTGSTWTPVTCWGTAPAGAVTALPFAGLTSSAPGALEVTTTSLPGATVGTPYSQGLGASGGSDTGYTWAITAGSLPDWASLNSGSGVISGTPTDITGTSDFTVQVTDSASDTATQPLSITTSTSASSVIVVTTVSLPTAQVGQAYSQTLAAVGGTGTYTWTVYSGSLPAGLSLSSGGVLSGTPTGAASIADITVQATDTSSNTGLGPLIATVITGPSAGPSGSWKLTFADEFDVAYPTPYGTGPNPNVWSDRLLNGDLGRNEGTPDQEWFAHGYYGHSVANSIWTGTIAFQNPSNFDPTITSALSVDAGNATTGLEFTAANISSFPGYSFTYGYIEARIQQPAPSTVHCAWWMLTRDGTWPPEIDIAEWQNSASNTGKDDNAYYNLASTWQTTYYNGDSSQYHVYGCQVTASTVTYYRDGSVTATQTYDGNARPWFMMVGAGVNGASGGSGYPAEYNVDYIRAWVPSGVPAAPVISSISPATGVPSGGDVTVTFGTVSGATSYRVSASPTDSIQDNIDNYGNAGNGISGPYTATGPSSPMTVTGLPNGRWNFTVAAINGTGYSPESAAVGPQIINIQMVTAVLPNASTGVAYTATLAAQAGVTPYTWSISTGTLPAGLTLAASTGVISGTPTGTGTSSFTVKVTGNTNWSGGTTVANSATAALSITVSGVGAALDTRDSGALGATGPGLSVYIAGIAVPGNLPSPQANWSGGITSALMNGQSGPLQALTLLNNPPAMRQGMFTAPTISNAVNQIVYFSPAGSGTEIPVIDTYNAYNTTTGAYIAPLPGLYLAFDVMPFAANATGVRYAGSRSPLPAG